MLMEMEIERGTATGAVFWEAVITTVVVLIGHTARGRRVVYGLPAGLLRRLCEAIFFFKGLLAGLLRRLC
jgi:hypothetical protein